MKYSYSRGQLKARCLGAASLIVFVACAAVARGQGYGPSPMLSAPGASIGSSPLLRNVGITQKMGSQIPLDEPFTDESGKAVTLRQYFGKPVILALVYYQCPSLCNMVLNGVVRSVKNLKMTAGEDYDVVAVSFDPRETAEMARAKKATYIEQLGHPEAAGGWHFLTGTEPSSRAVADAMGFHYVYDQLTNQYAHASGIMILTPEGKVTRYFYGIDYPARDVRLALVEASNNHIGTVVDQVLLYCFHYDPSVGKYGLVIMNSLRIAGILTLGGLIALITFMLRRDYHRPAVHREA